MFFPDQYSSHYSLAHAPWSEHNSFVKPIKQRFSCPADSRISPQNSYKTNIGQITHTTTTSRWTGVKSVSMDTGTHSLPCNLRDVRTSSTFHPRQLPPLPQISHPTYHEKVTCSEHSLPVSLPKHYVLETNSQTPLCLPHSDYSEYLECSEYSLPLAKYYVLEPDSNPPPQTSQEPQEKDYSRRVEHAELFEQSTFTKYYVLEKDSWRQVTKTAHMLNGIKDTSMQNCCFNIWNEALPFWGWIIWMTILIFVIFIWVFQPVYFSQILCHIWKPLTFFESNLCLVRIVKFGKKFHVFNITAIMKKG